MKRASSAGPGHSAAVLIGSCLLGFIAGAPAGLSRTASSDEPPSVALAGRNFAFDTKTVRLLRVDPHRVDLSLAAPGETAGPRVLLTLVPAAATPEPELWNVLVHGRFVEPDIVAGPAGLLVRRFKDGSPYAGESLFVPDEAGSAFSARCRDEAPDTVEDCMTTLRRDGVDVVVRFAKPLLAEWPRLLQRVQSVLSDAVRRAENPSA